MTNIGMIFRSKWMLAGVICEFLAFIAAVGNLFAGSWWLGQLLPNVALILATLGAAMVAGRVAWDYHGRGLNGRQQEDVQDILAGANLSERQREDVLGILASASLNATQLAGVAEAIKSGGLTERQKSELPTALQEIEIAGTVFAQKAISDAAYQLHDSEHGYVAVINVNARCQFEVQCVAPPTIGGKCPRQHELEPEGDCDLLNIARSIHKPFHHPAYLWKLPVTGKLRHTNQNDPAAPTRELVFSLEDCVPKWRTPIVGDYVLTRDASGSYAWKQKT